LGYGLVLPWVGFYWDDWPWIWRFHVDGEQAIRHIDSSFRPLAGIVLWIGGRLAGESPLGWQIYNLVIRWLGGVSLWWALRKIWPTRRESALWIAGLFLVYPSFGQQFVSVNSSRHLFPLISFFISIALTGIAVHRKAFWGWHTWMALLLSLMTMFTTEYYYGLELVRVAILWTLLESKDGSWIQKAKTTLKIWLPYLFTLVGVFAWRFTISKNVNYKIGVADQFIASPGKTILEFFATASKNFIAVTWDSWIRLFEFPLPDIFGPRRTLMFWSMVIISGLAMYLYFQFAVSDSQDQRWSLKILLIGVVSIFTSGLPFWVANLKVSLRFPSDRLTLPLILGACLVVVGLFDFLIKSRQLKNLFFAVVIAFGLGVQIQIGASYQEDWEDQIAFFRQIIWRIPDLKPGTAVLSSELPMRYMTDTSITPMLNWIFDPEYSNNRMSYASFYIPQRLGGKVSALQDGAPITLPSRLYPFQGSMSEAIVLYHAPPACVRILDPVYDRHLPAMPLEIEKSLPFSNLDQIISSTENAVELPEHIFSPILSESWCYYFEKADLSRQQKDWERVAEIGEIAFQLADSPNHASERVPFIEGYAHVGEWDNAVELTGDAIEINRFMKNMLCDTWERIARDAPESQSKVVAIHTVEMQLSCNSE